MKKKKKIKNKITQEDYIKVNKKLSREEEYSWHIGWVATDRPHKNKKKYDRKRDRKINSYLFSLISICSCFKD